MNWKLTRDETGEPAVDQFRDDPDEDLSLGYALIRALAEADETAVELSDGVWGWRKSNDEKMI